MAAVTTIVIVVVPDTMNRGKVEPDLIDRRIADRLEQDNMGLVLGGAPFAMGFDQCRCRAAPLVLIRNGQVAASGRAIQLGPVLIAEPLSQQQRLVFWWLLWLLLLPSMMMCLIVGLW
jgi:hypothetical protein